MGLLDNIDGDTILSGLLSAGAASGAKGNYLARVAQGLAAGERFKAGRAEQARQRTQDELQAEYRDLMNKKLKMEASREESMRGLARQFQIPGAPASAGMPANEMDSGMDMGAVAAKPAGYDYKGYASALAGVDPMAAFEMQQKMVKDVPKPITVAEGARVYDPTTKTELFSNHKVDKPAAVPASLQEYKFAQDQGYRGTFEQWDRERKKAGATNVTMNTGQKGFDNTLKLRGDFRSEPIYKAHEEVKSAYSQIQQGLKMQSPAGDLAGATKIMKLLDPGSVVRESELGMAMAATGLMDKVTNYAGRIMTGEKLTTAQRKDFQQLADALFNESAKQYNGKRQEYQGIAERNGLNIPDVVGSESSVRATLRWNPATNKLEQVK